ncbi:hypothetical protein [unidentified bacterial endosymbiont]|uniref:hypothetical protein n=1 Tax=unidentified bacterial endosymbiont TaxID=2355 RepID=UPI00209D1319|nr:hypothetical protein [unidentified bacterial endosymbiont]
MHPIVQKTLGGLSKEYYFRQFIFGLIFPAFIIFMDIPGKNSTPISVYLLFAVNTTLYPYSRFVYESIVDFIMGDNVFFVNAIFMLIVKIFTMLLCWSFAIFISPIGLLYLYYHHSKQ